MGLRGITQYLQAKIYVQNTPKNGLQPPRPAICISLTSYDEMESLFMLLV